MSRFHDAARAGNLDEVSACLAAGEDVNAGDLRHLSALMYAAIDGRLSTVSFLLEAGADVNLANPSGRTALHFSAAQGHLDVARHLIAHGANVNAQAPSGYTPALAAGQGCHRELLTLLEEHGANLEVRDREGRTAEEWLSTGGMRAEGRRFYEEHYAMAADPAQRKLADPATEARLRARMNDEPCADEFAARHGRRTIIWSYTLWRYADPEVQAWAYRVSEVLRSQELLEQCEERWLTGDALEEARRFRSQPGSGEP